MVVIRGPSGSKTARVWLGKDMYGKRQYRNGVWVEPKGVVGNPYPIGLLGKIRFPYKIPNTGMKDLKFNFFGRPRYPYHIPAFSFRPYPNFIAQYYSVKGWCYESRRTWHGIISVARRASCNRDPNSLYQIAANITFYDAVQSWRSISQETKDVYNKMKYPDKMAGNNRFIRLYVREKGKMPINWGREEIVLDIDGGGVAITTGIKADLRVPFPCKIKSWQIFADQAGSIVIDIWKSTYADFPPVDADSICAGSEPALSGVAKNKNDTASGFSLVLAEGDILRFNVDKVATVQRIHLTLPIEVL